MADNKTTYYALLAGERTRENPSGLVRRIHTNPPADEVFRRDLTWQPTDYLQLYELGHNDIEHVEITKEEADIVLDRWRATWPPQQTP